MKSIKRKLVYIPLSIAAIITYVANTGTAYSHSAGAPNFVSGSPYDVATCALSGCHNAYAVKNTPTHWISSNVPATGYLPGTTYTVTCKAVSTVSGQNSNFGFECTPENKSGKLLGTLANIVTSGAHSTQIISSSPSKWVTHTSGSYQATDSTTWSFEWTAPTPAVGAVEFYATFNCGSGDSRTTAQIYRDSIHINQDSTAGIEQLNSGIDMINVFPNPVKDKLTITYILKTEGIISINLISLDGKKICSLLSNCKQGSGSQTGTYTLIPNLSKGTYLLELTEDNQATYKKIIVE